MFSKREIIIFVAGAQAFHTLSHIVFHFAGILPIKFFSIDWTQQLNTYAIVINLIVTLGLLWWASRLKNKKQF